MRTGAVLLAAVAFAGCGLLHRHRPPDVTGVDLNRASVATIERLPGITPSMAAGIVGGRPYDTPHALVERGILTEHDFARIADRVVVGEPRH